MKIAKKALTLAAALTMVVLGLTGCSGGGPKGVYFGEYKCSSKHCEDSGDLVRLTIDGNDVTFDRMTCKGVDDDDTSVGVLNDAKDTVAWTVEGKYEGSDPFTAADGGKVVTMGKTTYSQEDSAAAKALMADHEKGCS